MICRSPAVVTSDSPTPRLSTRLWMIVRASSRLVGSTEPLPLALAAVRVMVVPPRRPRPRLGVQVLLSPSRPTSATVRARRMTRVRPGRPLLAATVEEFLAVGDRGSAEALRVGPRRRVGAVRGGRVVGGAATGARPGRGVEVLGGDRRG